MSFKDGAGQVQTTKENKTLANFLLFASTINPSPFPDHPWHGYARYDTYMLKCSFLPHCGLIFKIRYKNFIHNLEDIFQCFIVSFLLSEIMKRKEEMLVQRSERKYLLHSSLICFAIIIGCDKLWIFVNMFTSRDFVL